MKGTDYIIVRTSSTSELVTIVNRYIKLGYLPIGGVVINDPPRNHHVGYDDVYMQSMIKYDTSCGN